MAIDDPDEDVSQLSKRIEIVERTGLDQVRR